MELLLDEANGMINKIEYCLQNEYDKSFKLQCIAVFYKGFYDAFIKRVHQPGKKRKFIELYLYAAGIIYANYIYSLKMALRKSRNPVDSFVPLQLDRAGKLALLSEMGIVNFLTKKFAGMEFESRNHKIIEILNLITGENYEQKHLVPALDDNLPDTIPEVDLHTTIG